MIRSLRGLLVASAALCALAPTAYAQNIPYTPGSGGNLGGVTCGTSVSCPKNALIDSGAGDATNPTAHSIKNSPVDSGGGDMSDTTNHAVKTSIVAGSTRNFLNLSLNSSYTINNAVSTAYTANQLLCTSTTASTCSTNYWTLPLGRITLSGGTLRISDATATAWAANSQIRIDVWSGSGITMAGGDRTTYSVSSGTALWLASLLCTSADGEQTDGVVFNCSTIGGPKDINVGGSNAQIYGTFMTPTGSGVTSASAVTLTATLNGTY
jgi:hypothetical protein